MTKSSISVIGAGYVGLCTAVALASKGYNVIAIESDNERVAQINNGIPPFHEPDLEETLQATLQNGNFICWFSGIEMAILKTDITFIAVGTPSKTDGSIDLKFVEAAAADIGKALRKKKSYHVVVVKSTVVPGTTQNIVKAILEELSGKKSGIDFGLCMNPEFLRQGSAFKDTFKPDRLVIGAFDEKSGDFLENFYKAFYDESMPPIVRTSLSTAELIKYASNSMLATKISFINTIANICEKIPGADVKVVAKAMGLDRRIGPLFLNAGLGYGGSCFPKDVKALVACSRAIDYTPKLLEEVEDINRTQPLKAVEFCRKQLDSLKGKNISILGLAFKPDTDDMREASSIPIVHALLKEEAKVTVYDPVAIPVAKNIFHDKVRYADSALSCLKDADCCVVVTEWEEFKKLKPEDFITCMKQPILIDGRRIYDPQRFRKKTRFAAVGLGR